MDLKEPLKCVVDCVNEILEKDKNNKLFYPGLHTNPKLREFFQSWENLHNSVPSNKRKIRRPQGLDELRDISQLACYFMLVRSCHLGSSSTTFQ